MTVLSLSAVRLELVELVQLEQYWRDDAAKLCSAGVRHRCKN